MTDEEITAYIRGLISAERERCAKIAEYIGAMYGGDGNYSAGGAHAAQAIAERIRSGTETIETE